MNIMQPFIRTGWLGIVCWLAVPGVGSSQAAPAAVDPETHRSMQARIVEVSQQVTPSVVHVEAIIKINDRRNQVTGSGFIVDDLGRILTNHHVVERAEKVQVIVPGRKGKITARILGTDKQTDIAVLGVDPKAARRPAKLGSARDLQVGQWVLAVGNPYGLDGTVSLGIVSAKGRNLGIPELLNDFIQTDAMIDRGSSGGPLVDLQGRVVGINSRGQGRGIGFTIPIDTALQVMEQLLAGGVERGWLGVTVQPLDRELADYFGHADATGVIVNSVSSGSPADRAGLLPGDIVIEFQSQPVEAEKEEDLGRFQRMVASMAPGQKAQLKIQREGRVRSVSVELASAPAAQPDEAESHFGFHVQEITEAIYRNHRLALREGAFVSFVARGSPAAEAGVTGGDVIARIDDQPVRDLESFRDAMEHVAKRDRFLITARRGDDTVFLLLRPGARPVEKPIEVDRAEKPAGRSAD